MLGLGIVAPLMPIYAENLGASGIWLGIIFSGYSVSRGILMPLIGKFSDKKGRKTVIVIGLIIYTITSLAYVLANSVYDLTGIRIIHGVASAMVTPIAMAYIGEISPKGKEGSYMGTFNISLFLGFGFGPFLGGFLTDSFGMASAFYAISGLSSISLIITMIYLPNQREIIGGTKEEISFKNILSQRIMKGLFFYRIANSFGFGAIMAFLPILASTINLNSSQIGIVLTTNIVTMAILQRPFGKFADVYNKMSMIIFGSLLRSLCLFLMIFSQNFFQLLIVNIVMGVGGGVSNPASTALSVGVGRKRGMGSTMGIFNTAWSLGLIIAPILSGILFDTFGLGSVFYLGGSMSILGTAFLYTQLSNSSKD
jgi:MFS family permease